MIDLVYLHKKAQKNIEKFSDREHIHSHLRALERFPDSGDLVRIAWSRGDRDADILEVVLAGTLDDDIFHSDGRTGLGPGFNDVRIELSECMKIHFKADGL